MAAAASARPVWQPDWPQHSSVVRKQPRPSPCCRLPPGTAPLAAATKACVQLQSALLRAIIDPLHQPRASARLQRLKASIAVPTGWPGRARRPGGVAAAAAPHPTGAGRDHRPAGRRSAACRHHHAVAAQTTGRGGQSMSGRPLATLGRMGGRPGETRASHRSFRAAGEQCCQ